MTYPDVSRSLTSEVLLMIDSAGKRHVGYFHCNGRFYRWDKQSGLTTLVDNIVSWEYLNHKEENEN